MSILRKIEIKSLSGSYTGKESLVSEFVSIYIEFGNEGVSASTNTTKAHFTKMYIPSLLCYSGE